MWGGNLTYGVQDAKPLTPMAVAPWPLAGAYWFGAAVAYVNNTIAAVPAVHDYQTEARSLLLTKFKQKPKFQSYLDIVASFDAELESTLLSIEPQRTLATAVGVALDLAGVLIGLERHGFDDETYRGLLTVRVAALTSASSTLAILTVFAAAVAVFNWSVASSTASNRTFVLRANCQTKQTLLASLVAEALAEMMPAGFRLILITVPPETAFKLQEA